MNPTAQAGPAAPFDPNLLRDKSLLARATNWLLNHQMPVWSVLRVLHPNTRLRDTVFVTRREEIETILDDSDGFRVRFGERIASLHANRTVPFGLGTDGPEYFSALKDVSGAMVLEDIPRIGGMVREFVEPRVANARELDVARLARLAQADCGRRYMGLAVSDDLLPDLALWFLAVGNYAFGPQKPDSDAQRAGSAAVAQLEPLIRASIDRALAAPCQDEDTVIGRLITAGMDPQTINITVLGMFTGMMSASTMAIANTAQVLLGWPAAMTVTQEAARNGDDEQLRLCLLEALRFKPIFPAALRDCAAPRVIAAGTRCEVRAQPGDLVCAVTQSAMFDGRRVVAPKAFNPGRSPADTLVFGYGRHWCAGFAIGRAQLVETLKPLLKRGFYQSRPQRKAITYFGAFPEYLPVTLR